MASLQPSPRSRLRVPSHVNDNQCVEFVTGQNYCVYVSSQIGLNPPPVIARDKRETVYSHVDFCVGNAHSVIGMPQKKGVIPFCCQNYTEIKYVKDVSCVGHLSSANLITNVPTVAIDPPFWEKWEALGSSPKVVTTLREGYTLPFRFRPNLTRSPTVISNYLNPQKQSHLLVALYQLVNKNAVEPVANQNSLGFYNWLFLVPKPNNRWRPILDLSTLNTFLNTESFKMETPETIRTSLQTGEWVTSIDFKDAYFHIPIHSQSRKYMCFHIQGWSYQFKALPFGLSTALTVHSGGQRGQTDGFTEGCKNPPVPRRLVGESHVPPNLSPAYTDLGSPLSRTKLAGKQKKEKSELDSKQVFNFIDFQFDLKEGKVRPTPESWQALTDKIQIVLSGPVCPVRQFMSLEGQLEGTRITRKGDTCPQVAPRPLKVVAGGKQCAYRSTITPTKTCCTDIYRCIKRRVGCSLK